MGMTESCEGCNGAGFTTLSAIHYRRGHAERIMLPGRLPGVAFHGRRPMLCEPCEGHGRGCIHCGGPLSQGPRGDVDCPACNPDPARG